MRIGENLNRVDYIYSNMFVYEIHGFCIICAITHTKRSE